MALHFTDSKSNGSAAAIKTPFLIEDILDRNSIKAGQKIHYKNQSNNVANQRNNNSADHPALNNQEKNLRNNHEMTTNDEEYRKLLQSDR